MEKANCIKPLQFNNENLYNVVEHFAGKYVTKEKLYIRNEELELLPLFLRTTDPEEFGYHKCQDHCFFQRLLCLLKDILEKKTSKLLFLTLRNGNYVILDSWHMKLKDWQIESRYRDSDFLILMELYKQACDKIPNIKSVEDFLAVADVLSDEELSSIFEKIESNDIRAIVSKYKKFE